MTTEGEAGEGVVRRRPRLDRLLETLGAAPVLEMLGVDAETLGRVQAGLEPLGEEPVRRLEGMAKSMGMVVEWWEDEAPGVTGESVGIELEDPGVGVEELPVEGFVSRSWSWERHEAERRASLRAMHRLAMMTQYRLGVRYQSQLAMFELVAKIEWLLIYLGETLPDPGMEWDGDRRMRELDRRASRLLWVQRERDREHGGVRGIFNWLTGRTRMSAKELVRRMLEEADDMMGVLPEGGEVMGMRLPVSLRGDEDRYVEVISLAEEMGRGVE